jgi:hypothetical protein
MRSVAILIIPITFLCSCQKQEVRQGAPIRRGSPQGQVPTDGSTIKESVKVPIQLERVEFFDRAVMGPDAALDGTVTKKGSVFSPGKPLRLTVYARMVPSGLVARILVFDASGAKRVEEQKEIPERTKTVSFAVDPAPAWPAGEGHVEIYLGGNNVDSKKFTIEKKGGRKR